MLRILALLLVVATPLFAQVRESIEVRLLELEVVVLDRDGKPVEGLTRGDFEVQLSNRPAEVTNFYAVRRGAMVDEAPNAAASPDIKAETSIPTSLVIVVDDTRLGPGAKRRAIAALRDYVKENVGPSTMAMLARWTGGNLDVVTRPTERAGKLLVEIDRLASQPAQLLPTERRRLVQLIDDVLMTPPEKMPAMDPDQVSKEVMAYAGREAHEVDRVLEALHEVVRIASSFDGRRVVLYLSEGLPLMGGAELFDYWDRVTMSSNPQMNVELALQARQAMDPLERTRFDRSRRYRELARDAQRNNVSFYTIDAGGLRANDLSGPDAPLSLAKFDPMAFRLNLQDGIRYLANETGGRFIANENNLGRAMTIMSEQYKTYYSLGVRAPSTTRLEKVTVKVKNRPGTRVVTARYRRALSRDEALELAVRTHFYTRAIENPLGVTLGVGTPTKREDGRCVMPVSVTPAAGTVWFALLDERQQESDVRRAGDSNTIALGVKPGKYVLSVAVVSPSGETSYLQSDIDCR